MPDRIPHDVFHRAPQQLFESHYSAGVRVFDRDAPISRARFEIAVVRDFLHQIRQVESRRRPPVHTTIDPRKRKQLPDQRIQPPRF